MLYPLTPSLFRQGMIALTLLLMLLTQAARAQGQAPVKIGSMAWNDSKITALITKKQLEQQGYAVQYTVFSEWGIAFAAQQKGDVHLLLAATDFIAASYWEKHKERLEKVSTAYNGVFQGLVVPRYMDVHSVADLNRIADQVGGRIIGQEPSSGLMRETAEAIKAYDLKYQLITGSTAASIAELQAALERRTPIVTMLWTPSWMMQKFDVKFLADPKGIFAPPQSYYWLARKGFLDGKSRLRQSIATVYVPVDDIERMTAAMNDGKTVEQVVDDWWHVHQKTVNRWKVMGKQ